MEAFKCFGKFDLHKWKRKLKNDIYNFIWNVHFCVPLQSSTCHWAGGPGLCSRPQRAEGHLWLGSRTEPTLPTWPTHSLASAPTRVWLQGERAATQVRHVTPEWRFDWRYCLSVLNESEAYPPPTEHRQPSGSALSHSHCVAGHANISTGVVLLCRGNDELSTQYLRHSTEGRQMGHLFEERIDYGYECRRVVYQVGWQQQQAIFWNVALSADKTKDVHFSLYCQSKDAWHF